MTLPPTARSVSLYDLFPATMMGGTLFIGPPGAHQNVQWQAEIAMGGIVIQTPLSIFQ
jgi:hypothetical protein